MTTVRPYGDSTRDGVVQLSFTLPLGSPGAARRAALAIAARMNLESPEVVCCKPVGGAHHLLVLYARAAWDTPVPDPPEGSDDYPKLSLDEVNELIETTVGRRLVVVGACTGTDAHTVGLDAILNAKGFAGSPGLERFHGFEVHNLGSQVANEALVAAAVGLTADAVLVSQVVTHKDLHLPNLTQLVDMLEAEGLRERFLLVLGGPRITPEIALELGFDTGFGAGTSPLRVAGYIAHACAARRMTRT